MRETMPKNTLAEIVEEIWICRVGCGPRGGLDPRDPVMPLNSRALSWALIFYFFKMQTIKQIHSRPYKNKITARSTFVHKIPKKIIASQIKESLARSR